MKDAVALQGAKVRTLIEPSEVEIIRRDAVISLILSAIREDRTIKLPPFDRHRMGHEPPFALAAIGESESPYTGTLGPYRYHFEGEEDLLHLFIIRKDMGELSVEDAQSVASFLYGPVPKALIWLKPGEFSQHFYIGHDELTKYLEE